MIITEESLYVQPFVKLLIIWFYIDIAIHSGLAINNLLTSHALDRVDHVQLFHLLLKRDLPGVVVRFLFDSNQRQRVCMNWNNTLSAPMLMKNGVKQGVVVSPVMLCVYFYQLIYRLRNTGMGCYIGHINYGQCGYTDDIQMLSPSVTGLYKQ